MVEAIGWSEGSVFSSAWSFTAGASIQIPSRSESETSTSVYTCLTGTARAGRPYTTACSPNKMILPNAEALVMVSASGKVKDGDHCQAPQQDCDLQGAVLERDLIGRARRVTGLDQLQITKNTINNKRNGEHHGMVGRQVRRGKGIKRICHNRHARNDGDV